MNKRQEATENCTHHWFINLSSDGWQHATCIWTCSYAFEKKNTDVMIFITFDDNTFCFMNADFSWNFLQWTYSFFFYNLHVPIREIHPLDPQPHKYCMLASMASAPRVTRCSLGLYWSRDLCSKHTAAETGWLGDVILSRSDSERRRNLKTQDQCPLPVYYSQVPMEHI